MPDEILEESPPILGSWQSIYIMVFLGLVIEIILFAWITSSFGVG